MFIEKIDDLGGCKREDKTCSHLLGCLSLEPLNVGCRLGNEAGRGYCRYFEPRERTINQIIMSEKGLR